MMQIDYPTGMEKMPNNCTECKAVWCNLPIKKGKSEIIKKKCRTERHKDCPLREVWTEVQE